VGCTVKRIAHLLFTYLPANLMQERAQLRSAQQPHAVEHSFSRRENSWDFEKLLLRSRGSRYFFSRDWLRLFELF